MFKRLIRKLYLWRYGMRGGLQPPLGFPPWNKPHPYSPRFLWYRYRKWITKIENNIYRWTGLPKEWEKWLTTTESDA